MIDGATISGWGELRLQLEQEFLYLSTLGPAMKESKVILTTLEESWDEDNPLDISFQPSNLDDASAFNNLLIDELNLRGLPVIGTMRRRRT